MMYTHTFKRADGTEMLVTYRYRHGSGPTYSPIYGADSGDPAEVEFEDTADLTPEELEKCEEHIHANHIDDYSYGYDD